MEPTVGRIITLHRHASDLSLHCYLSGLISTFCWMIWICLLAWVTVTADFHYVFVLYLTCIYIDGIIQRCYGYGYCFCQFFLIAKWCFHSLVFFVMESVSVYLLHYRLTTACLAWEMASVLIFCSIDTAANVTHIILKASSKEKKNTCFYNLIKFIF